MICSLFVRIIAHNLCHHDCFILRFFTVRFLSDPFFAALRCQYGSVSFGTLKHQLSVVRPPTLVAMPGMVNFISSGTVRLMTGGCTTAICRAIRSRKRVVLLQFTCAMSGNNQAWRFTPLRALPESQPVFLR